jgi:hypothetical protein
VYLISEHLQRKKSVSNFEYIDVSQYLPIFNRLRDKRNWIAEYSRIKASFSLELLLMLKSDNINQENTKSYPFTVKNTCEFIKNDNILENKKLLLKDIQYFFAIENIPICQQKWEIYFGVELPWEEIWDRRFKNLANRKI